MGRKSRVQIMAEASKSFTDTPEFKEAVKIAAAEAVKLAAPQIIQAYKAEILSSAAAPSASGDGHDFMGKLALAIGELNDQGSGRKRVAPEILQQRARAHEKMVALLEQMEILGKKPRYRLVSKVYLDEQFIEPWRRDPATKKAVPQTIKWSDIPSEAMVPINDDAKAVFALYRESLGSVERVAGLPARRAYLTSRGLVVEGTAPAPRRLTGEDVLPDPAVDASAMDSSGFNPNAPEIRILGTIAPAAKQNVGPRVELVQ